MSRCGLLLLFALLGWGNPGNGQNLFGVDFNLGSVLGGGQTRTSQQQNPFTTGQTYPDYSNQFLNFMNSQKNPSSGMFNNADFLSALNKQQTQFQQAQLQQTRLQQSHLQQQHASLFNQGGTPTKQPQKSVMDRDVHNQEAVAPDMGSRGSFGVDTDSRGNFGTEDQNVVAKDTTPKKCVKSVTVVNGRRAGCKDALLFEDHFDQPIIDPSKWIVEHRIPTYISPDSEFNTYENIDETRYISNSKLYLKPVARQSENDVRGTLDLSNRCTANTDNECTFKQVSVFILPPVKSAKISSLFSFKYGKVEIKAKLPAGDWIFPEMYLEPKDKAYGNESGKMWIAYSRGNSELIGNANNDLGSTLLFGGVVVHPREPHRSKWLSSKRSDVPFNREEHTFLLDWEPGSITLAIDGEEYGRITSSDGFTIPSAGIGSGWQTPEAPFDKEYFISLGVGVGGINDFPDGYRSGGAEKPWNNMERDQVRKFFGARDKWLKTWQGDNVALQIDSVKVWAV